MNERYRSAVIEHLAKDEVGRLDGVFRETFKKQPSHSFSSVPYLVGSIFSGLADLTYVKARKQPDKAGRLAGLLRLQVYDELKLFGITNPLLTRMVGKVMDNFEAEIDRKIKYADALAEYGCSHKLEPRVAVGSTEARKYAVNSAYGSATNYRFHVKKTVRRLKLGLYSLPLGARLARFVMAPAQGELSRLSEPEQTKYLGELSRFGRAYLEEYEKAALASMSDVFK